jgi:hypothetical protein
MGAAAARCADARLAGSHVRPQALASPAGSGRELDAADASALIVPTGLLSFISRHHLDESDTRSR